MNHITAFAFDPEIATALNKRFATSPPPVAPERGDWKKLRELGNENLDYWSRHAPLFPDIQTKTFHTRANDGADIELRWYSRNGEIPGSAIVYAHGGGMLFGDLDKYDCVMAEYVHATGVPFLAVQYRLVPVFCKSTAVEDVFAGLEWLLEHADELGVDADRIAVMGDSSGAGLAAGVAIIAREKKVNPARQILIYPMLDDRTVNLDKKLLPFLTWTYDDNYTCWKELLGEDLGTDSVSALVAPARLTDFTKLAPTYIEVGELDIFRDENIKYAQQLLIAGIPTELHLHPGAPHSFERFAPESKLAQRAMSDRFRVIQSI